MVTDLPVSGGEWGVVPFLMVAVKVTCSLTAGFVFDVVRLAFVCKRGFVTTLMLTTSLVALW